MRKNIGGKLEPVDEAGQEAMTKIKEGAVVQVEVKKPRNVYFHRKFFAMLNLIFQNQDAYKSVDALLAVCKLGIGHVDVIQTRQGEVRLPKSISFAAMDNTEFSDFYDRAVNWMLEEVIPGLRRQDLDEEIEQQLMEFAK